MDRGPNVAQQDRRTLNEVSQVPEAVLDATRALLWVATAADSRRIAGDLVGRLGGSVVPVTGADGNALPVDISFGDGAPVLPSARSRTDRAVLGRYLPAFVEDAQRALELARQTERLAQDAAVDPLTGLANRRKLGRALGRLSPTEVVIMIDLDHFKTVNDTLGHAEGDRVLHALGRTIDGAVRARDLAGRYGGEEFVLILAEGSDPEWFLQRLRAGWQAARPHPITFSAGIAWAAPDPLRALIAADRAMYRAKKAGRDQWHTATPEDYR